MFQSKKYKNLLIDLIERAQQLGLPSRDIENSKEFLKHDEFELCLDTITTQLYEFNIKIDQYFYDDIITISNRMKIDPKTYSHLKELLSTEISPSSK